MAKRPPRNPRNPHAQALFTCKLFAPKSVPVKKGKGMKYDRKKDRGVDLSGPYFLPEYLGFLRPVFFA
jgi:hypothetical protein